MKTAPSGWRLTPLSWLHLTLAGFLIANLLTGADFAPLPLQAALGARSFLDQTPLSISRDGVWVAYTLYNPQRRERVQDERYRRFTRTGVPTNWAHGDIWVTKTALGESKNVTGDKHSNWAPAWSPNGRFLAFYSDRSGETCLWTWEAATGALRQVATANVRTFFGFEGPRWTPDSRSVLIKLLPMGMTVEQANALSAEEAPKQGPSGSKNPGVTVSIYSAGRAAEATAPGSEKAPINDSWANLELADLALIDIQTGNIERVASVTQRKRMASRKIPMGTQGQKERAGRRCRRSRNLTRLGTRNPIIGLRRKICPAFPWG